MGIETSTTLHELCQSITELFPDIAERTKIECSRLWFEEEDDEPLFCSSWFEALANVINSDINFDNQKTDFKAFFQLLGQSLNHANGELYHAIDICFMENVFWNVTQNNTTIKQYWDLIPINLQDMYIKHWDRLPYYEHLVDTAEDLSNTKKTEK